MCTVTNSATICVPTCALWFVFLLSVRHSQMQWFLACSITVGSDHRAHYLFIGSSRHGDCGNHTEWRGAWAPRYHTQTHTHSHAGKIPEILSRVTWKRDKKEKFCHCYVWILWEFLKFVNVHSNIHSDRLNWSLWLSAQHHDSSGWRMTGSFQVVL